jgi:hypothetical protein
VYPQSGPTSPTLEHSAWSTKVALGGPDVDLDKRQLMGVRAQGVASQHLRGLLVAKTHPCNHQPALRHRKLSHDARWITRCRARAQTTKEGREARDRAGN